jgi:succinate dehydrogenase / fumarate reductase iron-sulfur subunit
METIEETATAATEVTETRRFRVFRFKRGDRGPHLDEFDVPVTARTTLFDAMRWIQFNRDPSLALRHSCLHASCGTCGVRANGREVLMCVTAVHDLGREITVEPVANIPVLTDLVVDMTEFYARFPEAHPLVRESGFDLGAEAPEGVLTYQRYEDCIECGLCLSACPVVATTDRYVGPMALAWAQRILEEPRDEDVLSVRDWADDANGAWRCHAAFECTEACPSNVNPAARIMQLRGALVGPRLTRREMPR